jgi:O-antigen ligase
LPFLLPAYGYGQFINANHFAFLMEMALGLALGIAVCRGVRGRRLALYLIAAIPMWVALIRANSRAGALSILCQGVFLAFLLGSQRISMRDQANADYSLSSRAGRPLAIRAVLVIALLVAATLTIIFVGGGPLISKLDSISIELGKNSTDSPEARTPEARAPNIDSRVLEQSRLNTWRATWRLIKDHPIAGVGFGSYWIGITPYHQSSGWTTPQEAHNDYLELLASGGLVGVAIGVWFAIAFFRIALRKVRDADSYNRAVTLGALAGILPVAVHSLVDYGLHITINALVLTALISIVVINIREDETSFQGVDS